MHRLRFVITNFKTEKKPVSIVIFHKGWGKEKNISWTRNRAKRQSINASDRSTYLKYEQPVVKTMINKVCNVAHVEFTRLCEEAMRREYVIIDSTSPV